MNSSKKSRSKATTAWQLEFVRLIAFPEHPLVPPNQEWWSDLVSEQPEDSVSTRKKDSREDKGSFQGAFLSLTVEFGRVIWQARPPVVSDPMVDYPTFKESFRERLDWFVKILNPWLTTSCPPLLRLAFSAKLLQPAASAKEAYQILATHLPTVNLEPNPNDFLLQINRRKETSDVVDGLPLNRVSTWSKLNLELMIERGRPFKWPDRCYSALELDINTALEKGWVLPRESYSRLFQELASLGIDIAEHGDIP